MYSETNIRHLEYLIDKYKNSASTISSEISDQKQRKIFAEGFCHSVIGVVWEKLVKVRKPKWEMPEWNYNRTPHDNKIRQLTADIGVLLSRLDIVRSSYLIGNLYTSLLPPSIRSEWGVYYTPPPLVQRLISNVTRNGLNWLSAKIIDPACGGAAFLAPLAQHIYDTMFSRGLRSADAVLDHIMCNLRGIEIDPFAAWMSQVLTELRILKLVIECDRRLPKITYVGNALEHLLNQQDEYDLVIGNPPYGKIRLSNKIKGLYKRSLYGHANLYGLFTDLALRIIKTNGFIAFVTPTSFLAGQYFKALRGLLSEEAPPLMIDFVHQRDGVFQDVLQETVLVVFKKQMVRKTKTAITTIDANRLTGSIRISPISNYTINKLGEMPWLLPRTKAQHDLLKKAIYMDNRFSDYGFKVVTGQLVWNRHKDQLRDSPNNRTAPLIWAESILPDGTFRFKTFRANHKPYFELHDNQDYLITKQPCLLVQRTTAKEQHRRLISAVLQKRFLDSNGGFVVIENHLNIIKPINNNRISLEIICTLLSSQIVDQVFRCISGSVAVSAYELNALPLPDYEGLDMLGHMINEGHDEERIEKYIAHLYGVI